MADPSDRRVRSARPKSVNHPAAVQGTHLGSPRARDEGDEVFTTPNFQERSRGGRSHKPDTEETQNPEELYAALFRVGNELADQEKRRREALATLQAEVRRLRADVGFLKQQASDCWCEASALGATAGEASEAADRSQQDADAFRRKLDMMRRMTAATQWYATQVQQKHASFAAILKERSVLERESLRRKTAWESAVESLRATAAHVETLEKEKATLEAHAGLGDDPAATGTDVETKRLYAEQNRLMQEIRECKDALETHRLLDAECDQGGSRRLAVNSIVEEIADIEESADTIERRGQAVVEDLRVILERGAEREFELRQAHRQAREWLLAMQSTVADQDKDMSLLEKRSMDRDVQAALWRAKTDALVQDLTQLEHDETAGHRVADAAVGRPKVLDSPPKSALRDAEELAEAQRRRSDAQHVLIWYEAQRKPLEDALGAVLKDQRGLVERLHPLRAFLRPAAPRPPRQGYSQTF